MLFSQSHSKFPSAGQKELYIIPLPKYTGSLGCGCARYDNAQVSALPSAGLCVAQLEQQIGTVPAAQLPQFTLWHLCSSCQERSLGAVKTRQRLIPLEAGGKKPYAFAVWSTKTPNSKLLNHFFLYSCAAGWNFNASPRLWVLLWNESIK